jgi:hypothetical protein
MSMAAVSGQKSAKLGLLTLSRNLLAPFLQELN